MSGQRAYEPLQSLGIGAEVLSETLDRPDTPSVTGEPPATSIPETKLGSDPTIAIAATDTYESTALNPLQKGILLWCATMIVFLIGVAVYEIRGH